MAGMNLSLRSAQTSTTNSVANTSAAGLGSNLAAAGSGTIRNSSVLTVSNNSETSSSSGGGGGLYGGMGALGGVGLGNLGLGAYYGGRGGTSLHPSVGTPRGAALAGGMGNPYGSNNVSLATPSNTVSLRGSMAAHTAGQSGVGPGTPSTSVATAVGDAVPIIGIGHDATTPFADAFGSGPRRGVGGGGAAAVHPQLSISSPSGAPHHSAASDDRGGDGAAAFAAFANGSAFASGGPPASLLPPPTLSTPTTAGNHHDRAVALPFPQQSPSPPSALQHHQHQQQLHAFPPLKPDELQSSRRHAALTDAERVAQIAHFMDSTDEDDEGGEGAAEGGGCDGEGGGGTATRLAAAHPLASGDGILAEVVGIDSWD